MSSKGNTTTGLALAETRIVWTRDWARRHAMALRGSYGKAPCFAEYAALLDAFYASRPERLADFTIERTLALARALRISRTWFVWSSELGVTGTPGRSSPTSAPTRSTSTSRVSRT